MEARETENATAAYEIAMDAPPLTFESRRPTFQFFPVELRDATWHRDLYMSFLLSTLPCRASRLLRNLDIGNAQDVDKPASQGNCRSL